MKTPRLKLPFVRPSTMAFINEARRAKDYSWRDFIHGYVYGRWPDVYISMGLGEHPLMKKVRPWVKRIRRGFKSTPAIPRANSVKDLEVVKAPGAIKSVQGEAAARSRDGQEWPMASGTYADGYHGKVLPLEAARQLVQVNEPINLPDLEQVIPYPRARALILQNPDHLAVLDCPCRSARPDPCLPLDVCLIVGEPFASFIAEHRPDKARRISRERAEQILMETDARGNVHHAFFKDAMLGRFYAICNCCDCCCGAMQNQRRGTPMLASSGYVAQVDETLCIGCGTCVERCQFHAITLPDGYLSVIDEEACMGCGLCVNGCEQGALALRREESRGIPLELKELVGV